MAIRITVSSRLLRQVFASAMRRGFFTCGFACGFVPYVQPFLDRLKIAAKVQFQLIHLARLSFVSMAGSVFFLPIWVQECTGMNQSGTIR